MKHTSTIFLRLALLGIGSVGILLCGLMMSAIYREWPGEFPHIAYVRYPILVGISTSALALLLALRNAFILLKLIDKNESFTHRSVKTLQIIKYCALVIATVFTVGMSAVFYVADKDDAPGLILFYGAIFIGIPIVVAVFAGVCQRLFQNAIDIKSENDLTV